MNTPDSQYNELPKHVEIMLASLDEICEQLQKGSVENARSASWGDASMDQHIVGKHTVTVYFENGKIEEGKTTDAEVIGALRTLRNLVRNNGEQQPSDFHLGCFIAQQINIFYHQQGIPLERKMAWGQVHNIINKLGY